MKLPFFGHKDKQSTDAPDRLPDGTYPSANPGAEAFAQMKTEAAAASPDIGRQAVAAAQRLDVLNTASEQERPYIRGSEVSGEVPVVTSEMERPVDGTEQVPESGEFTPAEPIAGTLPDTVTETPAAENSAEAEEHDKVAA